MPFSFAALATELNTDPINYGYAPHVQAGNDGILADMLNIIRDGTNGGPAQVIRRPDISPNELLEAIDVRDFPASPNALAVAWFESATQLRTLRLIGDNGVDTRVKANIDRLVTNANGSQTRVNAIAVRDGSRAEKLFGANSVVSASDVAIALGRG